MMCQVVVEKNYREALSPAASAAPPQTASIILPQIAFATSSSIVNAVPNAGTVGRCHYFPKCGCYEAARSVYLSRLDCSDPLLPHHQILQDFLKTFYTCLYNTRESH